MFRIFAVVSLFLLIALSGCSSKQHNLITSPEIQSGLTVPIIENDSTSTSHNLLGMWTAHFDVENFEVSIESSRSSEAHFNVTTLISPVIQINSYDPMTNIIDIDVTITNPYPMDVYDVRLIIYTDAAGHMLTNDDCWTSLYDIPGGLPVNPFKAYAKEVQDRLFEGQTQHTENLLIYLPGGNPNVKFAIDASYPVNCEEPFKMGYLSQETLYDEVGSSALIQITVYDHYVINKVNSVELYCPEITGTPLVPFSYSSYDLWSTELVNNTGAPEGEYNGFIISSTETSGSLALYDDVKIIVIETPNHGWAKTWGGGVDDRALAVGADDQALYVSGYFTGTVDFDPGSGINEQTSNGGVDLYLSKFDKNGNFIWARTWGSIEDDSWPGLELICMTGLAVDSSGFIYTTGAFADTVDFDPGPEIDARTSNGEYDIFLSKFDTNGNFVWVRTWGGSNELSVWLYEKGYDLVLNNQKDVFVIGNFMDTCDFDPGPNVVEYTPGDHMDIFLSRFDKDGNFIWVGTWGGAGSKNVGYCVNCDSEGNIFTTGSFNGYMVDFDPSNDGIDNHTSNGGADAFISKFDTDNKHMWAKTWGARNRDVSFTVALDHYGNAYCGGCYNLTVDFNPDDGEDRRTSNGRENAFVSKFNKDGNFIWAITWGGFSDEILTLEVDDFGYFYTSDRCQSSIVDVDPGPDEYIFETLGGGSILSKFDIDGNFIWARLWNGQGATYCYDIFADFSGSIFMTGYFEGTLDFDPGNGVDEHTANGSIDEEVDDAYLMKLLPNGYWW